MAMNNAQAGMSNMHFFCHEFIAGLTEGGAVANRLRRRTSDQTVLGST